MYYFDDNEYIQLEKLLRSKKLFRYHGPNYSSLTDNFENFFSQYISPNNHTHSILLSSGTNALITALAAIGINKGDEVIIPAHTFVATALAVLHHGAIPIIANIDKTLTINPKEIEKKISSKTKAIIPVHIDGLICNMKEIDLIAKKHNLFIIEDAAQAIGGKFHNERVGTIGDCGCFSLNVDKIISAGEGGILTTKSDQFYEYAFAYHDTACQFGPTFKSRFPNHKIILGQSMRISEITSVMAREQLHKLDDILRKLKVIKKHIITSLITNLTSPPFIPLGYDAKGDCSISIHLQLNSVDDNINITKLLLKEKIIASPLTTRLAHFAWQWKDILPYKYKLSEHLTTIDTVSTILRIPLLELWTPEETDSVIEKLLMILKKYNY